MARGGPVVAARRFQVQTDVTMDAALEFRAQLNATGSIAPPFNDLIANAAALALREHPLANGIYRDGRFRAVEPDQRCEGIKTRTRAAGGVASVLTSVSRRSATSRLRAPPSTLAAALEVNWRRRAAAQLSAAAPLRRCEAWLDD